MEERVGPDGSQRRPTLTLAEFEEYRRTHPNTSRRDQTGSGNWTELGPVSALTANGTSQPNGMGRVSCVAFHPSDANILYIGSPSGGFWKSTDGGSTWTTTNSGLSRLGVSSVVVHPAGPDTIFIGTGDRDAGDAPGYGVYRSIDGGNTWAAHNTGMGNRTISEIIMDPVNPEILIAAASTGIYRSTDGGDTWTQPFASHNIKDIALHPDNHNVLYAAGSNLYRSLDNGQSWTQITAGVPAASRIALAVSAADPDRVYLFAGGGSAMVGVYQSTDSATTFTTQATTPNLCGYDLGGGAGSQAWYDLVAVADPADANHLITGAINVWESFDAGLNWTMVTHWYGAGGFPSVHADDHALEYSPHSGNLYLGHDGGLHMTADGGTTWTDLSAGLGIAQVYKIGQSQLTSGLTINGYQDNGTAFYRDGAWYTEIGGDGMECIIDYTDDDVMYGALYYGDIRRSTDGGANFTTIAADGVNGITESGAWVTPYKLHPGNPDTMYVGYEQIWRSYDCKSAGNPTWTSISAFAAGATVRDLAISESDPDVIYVSRSGTANFYKTTNATAATPAWTDLDAGLPLGGSFYPLDIEIHPTDPNTVWIAFNGNIYESTDGGSTWTDISGTLPAINLNTIVFDDHSPVEAMYVGMDVGVYYRDNTLADWELYSTGLPNVEITELEIYYDSACRNEDKLKASTYGRGLWEADLKDPGSVAPVACFTASTLEACLGATVVFSDNSAYNPTDFAWSISPGTYNFVNSTSATSANPEVVFNALGAYTIELTATNGNGSDVKTRTNYVNVVAYVGLPLNEDFETGTVCATAVCANTSCTLPNGWTNGENGVDDDTNWFIDENGTTSGGTGPATDYNPGTISGNYVFIESSGCFNQEAHLISPCINIGSGTHALTFAYHMYGATMGELHLDIQVDGVWTNDLISPIVGDQGNVWYTAYADLGPYTGEVVKLRFRGITGSSFTSDMAIDDIMTTTVLPVDLLDFTANLNAQGKVQLSWLIQGEQGNETYTVERSADGDDFSALAQVPSLGTHSEQAYQFLDLAPLLNLSFYRLKITDPSGMVFHGPTVEVLRPLEAPFSLSSAYPNPFQTSALLDLDIEETQAISAILYNHLGQQVRMVAEGHFAAGSHQLEVKAEGLAAGQYWLRVRSSRGEEVRSLSILP